MFQSSDPCYFDLVLTVNGEKVQQEVPTDLRLLDFIRDILGLTGTKEVCSEGECGACTVIVDGKTVNSCLILAVEAHGSDLVTIEGITPQSGLSAIQQSFVDQHAVQCGYCIPGMVLSANHIKDSETAADRTEISRELSGNICRCTGYHKIVDAVEKVLDK